MKTKLFLSMSVGIACLLLVATLQARTWTSSDGSKTFEGELVGYDAATAKVSVEMNKPMQVFILIGHSNMAGFGNVLAT